MITLRKVTNLNGQGGFWIGTTGRGWESYAAESGQEDVAATMVKVAKVAFR